VGQSSSAQALGIPQLVSLLDDEDPDLVNAVGKLDPRHFRALVENLETLRLRHDRLLRNDSERLAPEDLFGKAARSGRTRLSVISSKFIGDNSAVDFWVARLLGELARWASRNPSDALQGVLFLDEADIYLPAQSKPATKEPLLDLLKRGRSAGLGVFLATQSPGDLDYRCRDNIRSWFVGRVAEKTAVDKMKPLLSESRINVGSKLALAKTGEFFRLEEGEVLEFKATVSLLATSQVPEEEILKLAALDAQTSANAQGAKR
jgi:DNA helicase HerA-like ATPase